MTEVRTLYSTDIKSSDGTSSASGLTDKADGSSSDGLAQQYGLFATSDYKAGEVILQESPIVVLSHLLEESSNQKSLVASASSVRDVIRSQFNQECFSVDESDKKEDETNQQKDKSSPLTNLILPKDITDKLKASSSQSIQGRTKKLRGMILAAATYAAYPPSNDDIKQKLFELYHPSLDTKDEEESIAVNLAKLAVECCTVLAAAGGSLYDLLNGKGDSDQDELLKLLLIYSCNAFEGGRLYHKLSRANHSCNPNAVVVEGDTADTSILKAACDVSKGSEITISYLGKELYAGYPVRQRKLRLEKHFVCKCTRCTGNNGQDVLSDKSKNKSVSLDLASQIPCPICHPRTSRYLDEDLMFDEEDDDLHVSYALPENGMAPEDRNLHCATCGGVTSLNAEGSVRKKKEGQAIKYMTMAEDKVYDQIETNIFSGNDEDTTNEQDVDRSLLQMSTATCGAKHWTTQILNLAIIEETLASLQSTLMSVEPDDEKMMEEILTDIAECCDGIEKAFAYAKSLKLNLDPAHWLFDYVLGLSRTLVGLGDEKSQKYGADWIVRVEDYATKYECAGMNKVVAAIKNAWKRGKEMEHKEEAGSLENDSQGDAKRRKLE